MLLGEQIGPDQDQSDWPEGLRRAGLRKGESDPFVMSQHRQNAAHRRDAVEGCSLAWRLRGLRLLLHDLHAVGVHRRRLPEPRPGAHSIGRFHAEEARQGLPAGASSGVPVPLNAKTSRKRGAGQFIPCGNLPPVMPRRLLSHPPWAGCDADQRLARMVFIWSIS